MELSFRMALVQGLGLLRSCGEFADALAGESLSSAFALPLVAEAVEGGRRLRELTREIAPRVVPGIFLKADRLRESYNQAMATWRRTSLYLESVLAEYPHLRRHPQWLPLMDIVTGPTSADTEGFPQLIPVTYNLFRDRVPHLFREGLEVLNWLHEVEGVLKHGRDLPDEARESMERGIKAIRTMTLTAAVTAPPDLWLLRQILSTHQEFGTLERLNAGEAIDPETYGEGHGLEPRQLVYDLEFLESRGYLERTDLGFVRAETDAARVLEGVRALPTMFRTDMVGELTEWLRGATNESRDDLINAWLSFRETGEDVSGWTAGTEAIDLGYHLMPMVLALRAAGLIKNVKKGQPLDLPRRHDVALGVERVLQESGLLRRGFVTELGERVFERGPGAYGIIGAYHTYLNQHAGLLRAQGPRPWVERGPNIFASRDANRKNFQEAIAALERFMKDTGYHPENVVEHALGLGVAIREFAKKFGTDGFHFYGADYEEAALGKARLEQRAGRLPAGMAFEQADIGLPDKLIRFIRKMRSTPEGQPLEPTVMIVGNGFHEVRHQTDERMIKIFEVYRESGIVLLFVEESGLSVDQLRKSAWNSYHSGFRWVHQTSGQGLRAPWPSGDPKARLSWSECAGRAGYEVVEAYTSGTRPLLPLELPKNQNPQISVTYFCVPRKIAKAS